MHTTIESHTAHYQVGDPVEASRRARDRRTLSRQRRAEQLHHLVDKFTGPDL